MIRTRVCSFASFLLALPLAGLALAQEPRPAYPPPQQASQQPQDYNQSEVKTFAGKISKSGGKYILEDRSSKSSFSLDDQKTAKKFDGKPVVVTGTLDTASNTIHVQKIESAA